MCYNNGTIDVSGRDPRPAGAREPKGQRIAVNSQVKVPGMDATLESDHHTEEARLPFHVHQAAESFRYNDRAHRQNAERVML